MIKHSDADAIKHVNMEDKQRRQVFLFAATLMILLLVGFGTSMLLQGRYLLGTTDFFIAVLVFSMILALKKTEKGLFIYRLGTGLLLSALIFWLKIGAADGAGVLWIFIFPLFSFFILGKREGLYWSLGLLCCCTWLFVNPMTLFEVFSYSMAIRIRCIFLLLLIILFTLNYESVKEKFQKAMKIEHANLLIEREKLDKANRLLQAEMNERKQAENELKQAYDNLEQRVEERTRELTRTNVELNSEIEERKKAEAQLVPLSTAIENAAEAIVITDEKGKIRYVNPAFDSLMGYDRAEILGRNPSFMKSDANDTPTYDNIWHTTQSGQVWMGHFFSRRKDGERIQLEATISPIKDVANRIVGFVAVSRDVTEKIEMENRLRQSQKMEAIGTLAGGIAHDFNNILGAILGYAQLAQINTSENYKVKKYIDNIYLAGERAKGLVQQILAFSRQSKCEMIPVDIGVVIKEAVKLLKASIPSDIEIHHHVKSDLGTVEADQTQIHQIVMNLCTNASHAMQKNGGRLDIDLTRVEISTVDSLNYHDIKPGQYLKLTVADTGHGMDKDTICRIFDPYFTTKDEGEGTGMGLAMVHGIVKKHGGDIKVYSEPGIGTSFHILFPLISNRIEQKEETSSPFPKGNEKILFIDDEKFLVDIGKESLESLGYKVDTRTSSYDALETFRMEPDKYQLIITDMTMPKMTGEKLASEIKKIRQDIPIILCTGYSRRITPENVTKIGISDILMKPLTLHELSNTVRKVLDEKPN